MHYHHHYAIGHMIVSSLIHAVIYGVVWRVMRHFTLPEDICMAVILVAGVALIGRIAGPGLRRRS